MSQCEGEGYLLIYTDTDEIHVNLISEDHYNRIMDKFPDEDKVDETAFETEPLHSWFSQTMCNEDWPYKNVKILGTVHIWAL